MTKSSVSPPTPGITPQDHARLPDAAREALAWFERFDRHAPSDMYFGGESKVRKALREAVRRCSYELRHCEACDDGTTYASVSHPMERPRVVPYGECSGSGRVRVFTYPTNRTRRA